MEKVFSAAEAAQILGETSPDLVDTIRTLVDAGQTPGQIGRYVRCRIGTRLLADLVEMSAAHFHAELLEGGP